MSVVSEQNKSQGNEQPQSLWNWHGVAIVFSSAVGFSVAYLYEAGFCSVFGIPKQFIVLDWTTILIAISATLGVAFLLFSFANLLFMVLHKPGQRRLGPITRSLVRLSVPLFLFLGSVIVFRHLWREWLIFVCFLIIGVFFEFVFPLITQRKVAGYRNKLESQEKIESDVSSLYDYFIKHASPNTLLIVLLLIFVLLLSFMAGRGNAMTREEFLVPSTYQDAVVLRIYGNNLICSQFDREKNEVEKSFFFIKIDDEPRPILRLEKVGPLIVKTD